MITRKEMLALTCNPENLICCTDLPPLQMVKKPLVLTG